MSFPLIKTLERIKDIDAKLVRRVGTSKNCATLQLIREKLPQTFEATSLWLRQCYNDPTFHETKMSMLNDALGTFGVEYTARGHNSKSPAIEYCNAGDTYATTLLFVRGSYRVGCWGNIVERGNYD